MAAKWPATSRIHKGSMYVIVLYICRLLHQGGGEGGGERGRGASVPTNTNPPRWP